MIYEMQRSSIELKSIDLALMTILVLTFVERTSIEIMIPYVDIEDSCVDVTVNIMYVGCFIVRR